MQPETAKKWLQNFLSANQGLLEKIPINMDLYGKYNMGGVHVNDPDPVPNLYDARRKV